MLLYKVDTISRCGGDPSKQEPRILFADNNRFHKYNGNKISPMREWFFFFFSFFLFSLRQKHFLRSCLARMFLVFIMYGEWVNRRPDRTRPRAYPQCPGGLEVVTPCPKSGGSAVDPGIVAWNAMRQCNDVQGKKSQAITIVTSAKRLSVKSFRFYLTSSIFFLAASSPDRGLPLFYPKH